jgi:hypothetical protein
MISHGNAWTLFPRLDVIDASNEVVKASNVISNSGSWPMTGNRELVAGPSRLTEAFAIHNSVVYDVLPMTCSAVRALLCR